MKLLIIADDLTGALDTGIKFLGDNVSVEVLINPSENPMFYLSEKDPCDVLVLCIPTRHLKSDKVYKQMLEIIKTAYMLQIPQIYKKIDSALRGNLGAELGAFLDAIEWETVCFVPALPEMDRTTHMGIHYIKGVPISETVFGRDFFNPVTESYIPDIICRQRMLPVRIIRTEDLSLYEKKSGIDIFDCDTQSDMQKIIEQLKAANNLRFLAGSSGFAAALSKYQYGIVRRYGNSKLKNILVICGSINPISLAQIQYAEEQGAVHIIVPKYYEAGEQESESFDKTVHYIWEKSQKTDRVLLSVSLEDSARHLTAKERETQSGQIARQYGRIVKKLLCWGMKNRIMVIGGDTLLGILEYLKCKDLQLVCELQLGVVLFQIQYHGQMYEFIAKSGGFGQKSLVMDI